MIRCHGRSEGQFVVVVGGLLLLLLLLGRHKGHSVLAGRENQTGIGRRKRRRRKEVHGILQRNKLVTLIGQTGYYSATLTSA